MVSQNAKALNPKSNIDINLEKIIHKGKRTITDWPKPGIHFIDILSMLAEDPSYLKAIVQAFKERCETLKPDGILAIDARGFIFAAPLAYALNIPLLVVRKKGKLPPPTVQVEYAYEYASGCLEITPHTLIGKKSLVLVDDILATGGTAKAVVQLVKKHGVSITEAMFVGELTALDGRASLNTPIYSCAKF
jgi:adenine phosphoribosyltransferase